MNASLGKLIVMCCLVMGLAVVTAHAQNVQGKSIKIDTIKFDTINLPAEARANAVEKELGEPWYMVEVKFSTEVDAEDVHVKFYVEAVEDVFKIQEKGAPADKKYLVLTGEQTYLNVPKGREHYAAMFLDPMSLIRYGGKDGARGFKQKNIYVQITAGDDKAGKNLKDDDDGWYDQGQQISGVLMGLKDSPWWPSQVRRYNRIKSSN